MSAVMSLPGDTFLTENPKEWMNPVSVPVTIPKYMMAICVGLAFHVHSSSKENIDFCSKLLIFFSWNKSGIHSVLRPADKKLGYL